MIKRELQKAVDEALHRHLVSLITVLMMTPDNAFDSAFERFMEGLKKTVYANTRLRRILEDSTETDLS